MSIECVSQQRRYSCMLLFKAERSYNNEQGLYNNGSMPEHRVKVFDEISFFERYNRKEDNVKRTMDEWSVNYQDLRCLINELKCKVAKKGGGEVEHQLFLCTVKVKDWPLRHFLRYKQGSRPYKLSSWCHKQFRRLEKKGKKTRVTFENGNLCSEYQHQVDLLREIGMPGSDRLG